MKSFFITGTDTGIGKTYATIQLARHFIAQGYRVAALKPVASGAVMMDGELRNEDALQLQHINNVNLSYAEINPYCFAAPISPHFAAAQQGVTIDFDHIAKQIAHAQACADIVLVEGVGGWLAPLSDVTTVADLAKQLNLPVILVVGLRLGCLNHAQLTARAVQQSGCQLVGWIANTIDSTYTHTQETIQYLQRQLATPLIAKLSHAHAVIDVINAI